MPALDAQAFSFPHECLKAAVNLIFEQKKTILEP